MNNTKTTKRALLSSVVAMLVCITMLIGTTFAWFTDKVTSSGNIIKSGRLDISATFQNTDANGTISYDVPGFTRTADNKIKFGDAKTDINENNKIIDEQLWEPGAVGAKLITVNNDGNLAAKIMLNFNVNDGGLQNALWYDFIMVNGNNVVGTFTEREMSTLTTYARTVQLPLMPKDENCHSVSFILVYGMKEEAGNEYQDKSFSADVTIFATQYTHESDSFDDQYDVDAEYDPVVVTATELAALMTPDSNGVINLEKNYIVTDAWTSLTFGVSPVVINGNGYTISGLNKPLLAGNAASDITINELTINASSIGIAANENGLGTAAFVSYMDANTSATFKKCRLVNSSVTGNERAAALVSFTSCSTLTIEDCSVENCEIKAVGGTGGLVGYSQNAATIKNSSVKNTSITSTEDRKGTKTPVAGGVIGTVGGATTFTNVTATNVTVNNNNATAVYSEMIGRFTGSGSITN